MCMNPSRCTPTPPFRTIFGQCPAQVKGLALVNPATSFDRSHWRVLGSFVANAPGPEAFGMAATLCLATTLPDTAMVMIGDGREMFLNLKIVCLTCARNVTVVGRTKAKMLLLGRFRDLPREYLATAHFNWRRLSEKCPPSPRLSVATRCHDTCRSSRRFRPMKLRRSSRA